MEAFMACRICLNTNVKLYDMSRYRLKSIYEDICGSNLQESQVDRVPNHVCTFCAALLNKFALFKEKCEHAKQMMEFLLAEHIQLTTEHIRKINIIGTNIALPYTIQIVHNLDSTTEIKEEKVFDTIDQNGTNGLTNEYECKEFLEIYTDFKNDSDDEPLSKKVKERKRKKKIRKEKHIENNSYNTQSELIEPLSRECNDNIKLSATNGDCDDYELVLLTKEQQMDEVLSRKESSNYQNSVYKCEYCFKGFMTELTFKNHMVRHDMATGPEACDVCHTRWADARSLRAHALVSHARKYLCRHCSHAAKSHHKAKEHLKWHKGYLFVCKLCGATFEKSTTHLTHMRLQHPTTAACDACGDCFLGQNGLNMHKKKAHRNIESSIQYLDCDMCGSKFRNQEALNKHCLLAVHEICDTKLRPCEHCGDSFPTDESFKDHFEMHQRADAIRACSECSRTFANERTLARHRARAHGAGAARRVRGVLAKDCVCEMCGYTCISRASLVYHQRIHTGEKPFECTVCPKRFSVYQRLQIHIRTHTGERPFKCSQCPKAFKHKAALNRHDRVHTGARPYRCATCGKAFSQSNSMKQHAASVHLKAPLYARKTKQLHELIT